MSAPRLSTHEVSLVMESVTGIPVRELDGIQLPGGCNFEEQRDIFFVGGCDNGAKKFAAQSLSPVFLRDVLCE